MWKKIIQSNSFTKSSLPALALHFKNEAKWGFRRITHLKGPFLKKIQIRERESFNPGRFSFKRITPFATGIAAALLIDQFVTHTVTHRNSNAIHPKALTCESKKIDNCESPIEAAARMGDQSKALRDAEDLRELLKLTYIASTQLF